MKKILFPLLFICFSISAQQGYRYDIVPGSDNTYSLAHKEIKKITYASSKTLAPTTEETTYDFTQLTGAMTVLVTVTPCYTADIMTCLFHADGSDRVVTFSTGFSAAGTLTVPASTYTAVKFTFNGAAWFETSRQNLVGGSVTTLLAGNGTVGTPAISFTSDTDCGLYRIGANETGVAENGAKVLDISTSGLAVTGNITATGLVTKIRTATTYTASATVTAAQLAGGVLTVSSGTVTLTMPTGTDAGTQLGAGAGSTFDFIVLNIASGGTATVAVNTNIVASGFPSSNTLTLANSATIGVATFRLTFISASVATLTRIN
jgi:hypothetical protein